MIEGKGVILSVGQELRAKAGATGARAEREAVRRAGPGDWAACRFGW